MDNNVKIALETVKTERKNYKIAILQNKHMKRVKQFITTNNLYRMMNTVNFPFLNHQIIPCILQTV